MARKLALILTLSGLLATTGLAQAQSVGAPAGREPATAPGGTEGMAGPRNEAEAIRSGEAIPVPPGSEGVPVGDPAGRPPGTLNVPSAR